MTWTELEKKAQDRVMWRPIVPRENKGREEDLSTQSFKSGNYAHFLKVTPARDMDMHNIM